MQVARNCVISMRYIMKNRDGVILEDTMASEPVNYLHGTDSIEKGLQDQLEGLKTGDRKKVYLMAASGLTTDDFEFDVVIDDINIATNEEILLGYPVNHYGKKCEDNCACYKHPNHG